jgi:hypothetical protein
MLYYEHPRSDSILKSDFNAAQKRVGRDKLRCDGVYHIVADGILAVADIPLYAVLDGR